MVIPENFPNISPIASSYPGHWVGRVTVLGVFFFVQQWPFYGWNMMNLIWSVGNCHFGFGLPPGSVLRSSYLPMKQRLWRLRILAFPDDVSRWVYRWSAAKCDNEGGKTSGKGRRCGDGDGIFECQKMRWSYDLDRNNWSHTSFIRKDIKYVFLSSNCCCPRCQADSSGRVATAPAEVSRKKDFKVGYHWGIDFHIMAPTAASWRNLWSQLTSK